MLYPAVTLLLLALCAAVAQPSGPARTPRDDAAAESLGWKLAVQAWTFRDRTATEAVETAARLGVKYIELYPGQPLSPTMKGSKVGPDLPAEARVILKVLLESSRVQALNFGVVNFTSDEAASRRVFEFAREFGIQTITCEPVDAAAWDAAERLAREFNIRLACHNHPKPSKYWNPDTVLESIKDRGDLTGACADTGHWTRSGLNTVECLKKYEGKLISLHFKDIAQNQDRPWGTGESDAPGMLRELRRQSFKGVVAIEYEHGAGEELERNVARCIAFFDEQVREIAGRK
jgi:L-ribulose-5-phosphate 3-epimerase